MGVTNRDKQAILGPDMGIIES